jgi:superfamily II DNA or RNA helicase
MRINIGSSFCTVDGASDELWFVREALTFAVPGAKYSPMFKRHQWDGKKRFFDYKEKKFPVGLLPYVVKAGKTHPIKIIDDRVFPHLNKEKLTLNTIELRDYQISAIEACLEKKNCLIEVATNGGKTAIFSGLIKKLSPAPTLVLTHRAELLTQTVDFIEQYTGLECGFITSKDILIKPVTVAMITTLINRICTDQEVAEFFGSLQCVIQDEVHHAQAKQFTDVLSACPAPYRWGFSGTIPSAKDFKGVLVRQFLGEVAFKISNKELIDRKISATPTVYLYDIDVEERVAGSFDKAQDYIDTKIAEAKELLLTNKIKKEVCDRLIRKVSSPQYYMRKVYDFVVKDGLVNNEDRNGKAVEVINNNPGKSVLIVVDYIDHGRLVEKLLKDNDINATFISGTPSEADIRKSALTDFKAGKLKVLISTNIIDEGIDISRIEVLILLAGKKSRRQLLQRMGRSLRKKDDGSMVKIYDFVDIGNKHLLKHSKERIAIYKEEQFKTEFI